MTASIPPNTLYVIQPIQHAQATRRSTVTYAVDLAGSAAIVITGVDTAFKDAWDQNFDTQVTLLAATGYFRASSGAPLQQVFSTAANRAGTRSSATQVSSVALRVTKRTAFVGRAFRGRMYLPWLLTETDVDEVGNLLPSSLTTFQGHADGFLAALAALSLTAGMQLLHNYDPDDGPDPEIAATPVTALTVQPTVGTQRRRIGL